MRKGRYLSPEEEAERQAIEEAKTDPLEDVYIKTLSEILGHSNVSITLNKYVHPSIQQKTIQMAYWNSIKGQIYGHVA